MISGRKKMIINGNKGGRLMTFMCNSCTKTAQCIRSDYWDGDKWQESDAEMPEGWTKVRVDQTHSYCRHFCEACSNIKDILE